MWLQLSVTGMTFFNDWKNSFVTTRPLSTIHKHRRLKAICRKHPLQLETRSRIEIAQLTISRPAVENNDSSRLPGSYVVLDALQEVSAEAAPLLPRFKHQF